jgi:ribonuclease E
MQPLATATGLVRTAASARADVATSADASNGRRRRGGRGKVLVSSSLSENTDAPLDELDMVAVSAPAAIEPASVTRRQDPELIAVPMDDEQEQVFGWLGLNPALLLESQPELDNLMVRIVRPGEDADSVLELARQQMAANSGRRRRRGPKGNGRGNVRPPIAVGGEELSAKDGVQIESEESDQPSLVEITPLVETPSASVTLEQEPVSESEPSSELEPDETTESRPGRRRRRSSATTADNA